MSVYLTYHAAFLGNSLEYVSCGGRWILIGPRRDILALKEIMASQLRHAEIRNMQLYIGQMIQLAGQDGIENRTQSFSVI